MQNPEATNIEREKAERKFAFEELLNSFESSRNENNGFIEYSLPYPKEQFLEYLTEKKNYLLHGSSSMIDELEPRQANDLYKKSGNKNAIYAVTDPVLPIFYAIHDRNKTEGVVTTSRYNNDGNIAYEFTLPKGSLEKHPFKSGVIYILDKNDFTEGFDDGKPTNEWVSENPVKPVGKLKVDPEDFDHFTKVKELE